MAGLHRHRSIARLLLAASFAILSFGAAASSPEATATALSRWTGGIDLYRSGVFTTQQTWLWCTAADVQIIRNIVDHQTDHTRANQQRYFAYMRVHDRYNIPLKDGTDPGGWTAGLRHFVDSRYRLVASGSFDSALRSAVTNLRKTNLPVAITVDHGNHGWVLTGFTASADPAVTSRFTVTSVRVVGPLWGLQSTSYGYDMRPDTKLTPSQLRGFFTPWHYTSVPMAWENRWVSIQPVATMSTRVSSRPAPTARPKAPAAAVRSPSPRPTTAPRPTPIPTVFPSIEPSLPLVALVDPGEQPVRSDSPASAPAPASSSVDGATTATLLAALAVMVIISLGLIGGATRGRRRGRTP